MADELFAFSEPDVARIRSALARIENGASPTLNRMPTNLLAAGQFYVGFLESSVAATTGLGTIPKAGSLNIYLASSTGFEDSGQDETCLNISPQAATTDRWTGCVRDALSGRLFIIFQACTG